MDPNDGENSTYIENLPVELINFIVDYLPVRDQQSIFMVFQNMLSPYIPAPSIQFAKSWDWHSTMFERRLGPGRYSNFNIDLSQL
ncbi:hypothetical protein TWF106_009984 [Orbilia oligospora]|uniref:F-box domain-containing protein n=1 Tax=Orbilia oligospora TaxID=2813651 RepID=A0A7C8QK71_ORBOL|nr:hypothetical protein TWF106_009984 [Orbilia oligospora]